MSIIRNYRKSKGLSQSEFSRSIGVDQTTVSKWESGASIPEISQGIRISQLTGISLDTLYENNSKFVTFPLYAKFYSMDSAHNEHDPIHPIVTNFQEISVYIADEKTPKTFFREKGISESFFGLRVSASNHLSFIQGDIVIFNCDDISTVDDGKYYAISVDGNPIDIHLATKQNGGFTFVPILSDQRAIFCPDSELSGARVQILGKAVGLRRKL
ncbi:MAG: helix-turn-helix transcriptional regulator [Clostridiaceae bacterium]|nr:helix-turn-helix transcriptional regulator [Clostridiaceae bacterium]